VPRKATVNEFGETENAVNAQPSAALEGQIRLEVVEGTPAVDFVVYGHAMPGGSKRGFVNPKNGRVIVTEDSNNKPWRQEVAGAARDAMAGVEPLHGALIVEFTFYRQRPKGHYGSGRNVGLVKGSAPRFPTTRPDVLKLARAVEDALTGIVWVDDSQIVDERLRKLWGVPERCEIVVREVS
jgi:Holliday junction resolvase RusA-like endonuclease